MVKHTIVGTLRKNLNLIKCILYLINVNVFKTTLTELYFHLFKFVIAFDFN